MRLPSRLHLNRHGVFGFRVLIPQSLRARFPCPQYRLTLRTRDPAAARALAHHLNAYLHVRIARIHRMNDNDAQKDAPRLIDDLAAERDRLTAEWHRIDAAMSQVDRHKTELTTRVRAVQADCAQIDAQVADAKAAGDLSTLESLANGYYELDSQLDRVETEARALVEREEEVLIEALHFREEYLRLGYSEQHRKMINDKIAEFERRKADLQEMLATAIRTAGGASIQPVSPARTELLSVVVRAYHDSQVAEGQWTPKSAIEIPANLDLWVRIVGDQPISRYDREQHRSYKAVLQKLPANLNKLPRYRELTIEQILALGDPPRGGEHGEQAAGTRLGHVQLGNRTRLRREESRYRNEDQEPDTGQRRAAAVLIGGP